MREFKTVCPNCGKKFAAQRDWIGLATECPKCGGRVVVRGEDARTAASGRLHRIFHHKIFYVAVGIVCLAGLFYLSANYYSKIRKEAERKAREEYRATLKREVAGYVSVCQNEILNGKERKEAALNQLKNLLRKYRSPNDLLPGSVEVARLLKQLAPGKLATEVWSGYYLEALAGSQKSLAETIRHQVPAEALERQVYVKCSACGGKGTYLCSLCKGSGKCDICNGNGYVIRETFVNKNRIAIGTDNNTTYRMPCSPVCRVCQGKPVCRICGGQKAFLDKNKARRLAAAHFSRANTLIASELRGLKSSSVVFQRFLESLKGKNLDEIADLEETVAAAKKIGLDAHSRPPAEPAVKESAK